MRTSLCLLFATLCAFSFAQKTADTLQPSLKAAEVSVLEERLPEPSLKKPFDISVSGYLQTLYSHESFKEVPSTSQFRLSHLFLTLKAEAPEEKLSATVQLDFGLKDAFLDAWIAYQPTKNITLSLGQKQTPLNNKELILKSSKLTFQDKSLLSSAFGASGRELGVYGEMVLGKKELKLVPQVAITSGDGRNVLSNDIGGLKYGARLDFYPFGFFKDQKSLTIGDLQHEPSPKLVLGAAYSYNQGVSHKSGEGHGDFLLLDKDLNAVYPNYEKIYADLLFKYRGFSFFTELAKARTSGNSTLAKHENGEDLVGEAKELYSYLSLGKAYNLQMGYSFPKGLGIDLRYASIAPEYSSMQNSVLQKSSAFTLGISKYFLRSALKLHTAYSFLEKEKVGPSQRADLLVQLSF
ncbi:hypothetical protein [Chryseobacterium sp. A321]